MSEIFRNNELEMDDNVEINKNYDYLDKLEPTNYQEEKDFDMDIWEDELENDLELLRIPYSLKGVKIPLERKERLFREYFPQTIDFDEKGNVIENMPYVDKDAITGETIEERLFQCGEQLGAQENVGDYFRMLSLLPFAKGYWYGKFSNAVLEDNDQKILEVSREIKLFDPEHAEEYLAEIVDTCFKGYKETPQKKTGMTRR